jgi:hypothetical protein
MTFSRLLLALLFVSCASLPATAQTFTRGQWNAYGSGSLAGAMFVGNGTAPYDIFADGVTSVKGKTMQQAQNGQPGEPLFAFSSGGIYVPTQQKFIALLTTGHFAGGSNEVNFFDLATGSWNPGGRMANPTVRLYMRQGAGNIWPSNIAYGGIHLTSPLGLIDVNNDYSAHIAPSQAGAQIACLNRQISGGIANMPGTNKIFLFGGFGYWDAPTGDASIGCTFDYVTKKYQFLDRETWPQGSQDNEIAAVWDPDQSRVLFTTELSLYSYRPGATVGSRVATLVSNDGCNSDVCSLYTAVYDTKRHRLLLFGGQTGSLGLSQVRYYDFNGAGAVSRTGTLKFSGAALSTIRGPAVLYDAIADRYIHHAGGVTLVSINPDTGAATSADYRGGITPSAANEGGPGCCGASHYYRFWYWPEKDAYVSLPRAIDSGVFVFPPVRSTQASEAGPHGSR